MDYLFQIFNYGLEGYKTYETKQFVDKQSERLFKLLTLLVIAYYIYKILRG